MPEEWLDVFVSMVTELPEMKQARDKVQAHVEAFRRKHPTYRKAN